MRETELPARGMDGSRKMIAAALVAAIVAARVEQIMQRVAEIIRPIHRYSLGAARATAVESVVLCGGGAALSGIAHMARGTLGVPVRIAGPWGIAGSGKRRPRLCRDAWRGTLVGNDADGARCREHYPHGTAEQHPSGGELERGAPGQSRWQAWLREFLP